MVGGACDASEHGKRRCSKASRRAVRSEQAVALCGELVTGRSWFGPTGSSAASGKALRSCSLTCWRRPARPLTGLAEPPRPLREEAPVSRSALRRLSAVQTRLPTSCHVSGAFARLEHDANYGRGFESSLSSVGSVHGAPKLSDMLLVPGDMREQPPNAAPIVLPRMRNPAGLRLGCETRVLLHP